MALSTSISFKIQHYECIFILVSDASLFYNNRAVEWRWLLL